ncbi:MAG: hypothetical protein J5I91_02265 [Bacteroidetes bacterium]|nr:hypothetical protein [Bacteroidota bacterium]
MKELLIFQIIVVAFLSSITILIVVDLFQLRAIKRLDLTQTESVSIDKYHELKWRLNLFLSVVTIVTVLLGFLGWSLRDATNTEIANMEDTLNSYSDSIKQSRETLINLESRVLSIQTQIDNANLSIGRVNESIRAVRQQNIQKWEFQIMENVPVYISSSHMIDTVYFKNLKTSDGRPVPTFEEIPLVNVIKNDKTNFLLFHTGTTREYFIIEQRGNIKGQELKSIDIWIMFK